MSKTYHTVKVVLISEDTLREVSSFSGIQSGALVYHPLPRMSCRENRSDPCNDSGEHTFQLLPDEQCHQTETTADVDVHQEQGQFYI